MNQGKGQRDVFSWEVIATAPSAGREKASAKKKPEATTPKKKKPKKKEPKEEKDTSQSQKNRLRVTKKKRANTDNSGRKSVDQKITTTASPPSADLQSKAKVSEQSAVANNQEMPDQAQNLDSIFTEDVPEDVRSIHPVAIICRELAREVGKDNFSLPEIKQYFLELFYHFRGQRDVRMYLEAKYLGSEDCKMSKEDFEKLYKAVGICIAELWPEIKAADDMDKVMQSQRVENITVTGLPPIGASRQALLQLAVAIGKKSNKLAIDVNEEVASVLQAAVDITDDWQATAVLLNQEFKVTVSPYALLIVAPQIDVHKRKILSKPSYVTNSSSDCLVDFVADPRVIEYIKNDPSLLCICQAIADQCGFSSITIKQFQEILVGAIRRHNNDVTVAAEHISTAFTVRCSQKTLLQAMRVLKVRVNPEVKKQPLPAIAPPAGKPEPPVPTPAPKDEKPMLGKLADSSCQKKPVAKKKQEAPPKKPDTEQEKAVSAEKKTTAEESPNETSESSQGNGTSEISEAPDLLPPEQKIELIDFMSNSRGAELLKVLAEAMARKKGLTSITLEAVKEILISFACQNNTHQETAQHVSQYFGVKVTPDNLTHIQRLVGAYELVDFPTMGRGLESLRTLAEAIALKNGLNRVTPEVVKEILISFARQSANHTSGAQRLSEYFGVKVTSSSLTAMQQLVGAYVYSNLQPLQTDRTAAKKSVSALNANGCLNATQVQALQELAKEHKARTVGALFKAIDRDLQAIGPATKMFFQRGVILSADPTEYLILRMKLLGIKTQLQPMP